MHYVYVLRCGDGSLYTGYTTDVDRRLAEHRTGDGAKYTRGRDPIELVHVEEHRDRSAAMTREYEIKQLSRPAKTALVDRSPTPRDAGPARDGAPGDAGPARDGAPGDATADDGRALD